MKITSNTHGKRDSLRASQESSPTVCIDKVGVLCSPRSTFMTWVERESETITTKTNAGRVKGTWNLPDIGHFAQRKNPDSDGELVVYTFNPNKLSEIAIAEALSHLEPIRITRVDVALDYFICFSDCRFDYAYKKREVFMNTNGEVESMAFGRRGQRDYLRVYDKGKERRLNNDWTRIEVEHRPRQATDPFPQELFDGLKAETWPSMKGLHLSNRSWLYLAKNAPSRDLARIRNAAPARASELLSSVRPLSPSPVDVYREHRDRLREECEWILRLGGTVTSGSPLLGTHNINLSGGTTW